MKKCPYCAEEIQKDAIKCKHCGEWLNKSSENPIVDTAKNLYGKSLDFVKEQQAIRKEKRFSHLYIPTDEKPLMIEEVAFYPDYFTFSNKKIEYSKIVSIKYLASSNSTNGITTDTVNEFKIYINSNSENDNPLEKRELLSEFNLSVSSWMFFGSNRKLREKTDFVHHYLNKKTLENRLHQYLKVLKRNGYFTYPAGYKIHNNGEIEENGKIKVNIYQAAQDGLLNYGDAIFSSPMGRNQYYNPSSLIIWSSKNSSRMLLFSNKTELAIVYDRDVFDILISSLLKSGKILE